MARSAPRGAVRASRAGARQERPRAARAFVRAVERTLRERELCAPGQSILVAVSGGPDSVALLRALVALAPRWRFTLAVAHCNYGLRARASDRDEAFVRALCAQLAVPCHVRRVAAKERQARPAGSLQAWARDLRYGWFAEVAAQHGMERVAVGHTADDQAETVLLWMLRGAGLTGLAGMRARRADGIMRPLFDRSRADVLAYLSAVEQDYRTDASNARGTYRRNHIRHQLLPALAAVNPAIVRTLARQADLLAEDDALLGSLAAEAGWRVCRHEQDHVRRLPCAALAELPLALQRRIVRDVLMDVSTGRTAPTADAVAGVLTKVLRGRSGASLHVHGLHVRREYGDAIVARPAASSVDGLGGEAQPFGATPTVAVTQHRPAQLSWPATGQQVTLRLDRLPSLGARTAKDGRAIGARALPVDRQCTVVDADRVTPRFYLRAWKPGDWFCPVGMGGHRKKLQDFWSDAKVPRAARAATPVLVAPEGIVWVVGYRADQRFVPSATTTRVLVAATTPSVQRSCIQRIGKER